MTKPISNERATWLSERLTVVENCITISTTQMYAMQSGGAMRDDMQRALMGFKSERNAIAIELRVLKELGVSP